MAQVIEPQHECLMAALGKAKSTAGSRDGIITPRPLMKDLKEKVRILLVEDNTTNKTVVLKILEKLGYNADTVSNGTEALDALKRRLYDLVLMDIQMPGMDGFKATRAIRNSSLSIFNPDVPIIAMTAHAMKGDKEKCLQAGMDDYLSKPIRPEELAAVIERWIAGNDGDTTQGRRKPPAPEPPDEYWAAFDRAAVLDRLDGDEEMLVEVMETFLEDAPQQLRLIEEAVTASDATQIRFYAHTLKGSAGNVGATGLQTAAYWLEKASLDGNPKQFRLLLDDILDEFSIFRRAWSSRATLDTAWHRGESAF